MAGMFAAWPTRNAVIPEHLLEASNHKQKIGSRDLRVWGFWGLVFGGFRALGLNRSPSLISLNNETTRPLHGVYIRDT